AIGTPMAGESRAARERAVVDFSLLAAEEARAPRPRVPKIAQPKVKKPVDMPLDDELRALLQCDRKVPFSSPSNARRSSARVFMTMGPYHATGSASGRPDTRRNRTPSSPASTVSSSPRSNSTSERSSARLGGAVSAQPAGSVGTSRGADALQN